MSFSLWRNEEWKREIKAAYKLWRWVNQTKNGVISGLPGSKKTLRTLLAAAHFGADYSVVFAVPLRRLRDEIAARFSREPLAEYRNRIVKIRAHDEVCLTLSDRLVRGMNYWKALADHVRAADVGEEECGWREEMKKAIEALKAKKIIITTHTIALVLLLYARSAKLRNVLFFFDEGDDFIINMNEPIPLADLKVLEDLDPKRYKRMIKLMSAHIPRKHWSEKTGLFVRSDVLFSALKNAYFITATWPRTLTEALEKYYNIEIRQYRMRSAGSGDIIILNQDELHIAEEHVWRRKLAPQLLQIASTAIERHGAIAFIARSKENNLWLTRLLEEAGYEVWSDARDENEVDYRDAEAVTITVLGKGYRGINFFSWRTGGDFPVIAAFFQASVNAVKHPLLLQMLEDEPDDEYAELPALERDILHAKNVQALFRVNRYRSRKHVVILLDARWWSAIFNYAHYWYIRSVVLKATTDKIAETAVPVIESFSS